MFCVRLKGVKVLVTDDSVKAFKTAMELRKFAEVHGLLGYVSVQYGDMGFVARGHVPEQEWAKDIAFSRA